jgi:hypothetical protein
MPEIITGIVLLVSCPPGMIIGIVSSKKSGRFFWLSAGYLFFAAFAVADLIHFVGLLILYFGGMALVLMGTIKVEPIP